MNTLRQTANLSSTGARARAAARLLARASTAAKNQALLNIAAALAERQAELLAANALDYKAAQAAGVSDAWLERLLLTPERLSGMAVDVRSVAGLPDPIGEEFDVRVLPNGLRLGRRRVPLGVIGAIYESRPNVTVD
ncbi:MAG: gamma-glutamyl-phosphate reductase, partial [Chloroflexi bacterium]|nr:gamma-glutamyl-phosphate reductase [Chloroflexota bacterium]